MKRHNSMLKCAFGLIALATVACLAGCARPYGVPPFTQLVVQAPGQAASFAAPDEGTVYVAGPGRPGQERHLVYTGLVRRGETITVDPPGRVLIVDGKPANVEIDGRSSFYEIWFQPIRHDLLAD